jgi:hypothetical protein
VSTHGSAKIGMVSEPIECAWRTKRVDVAVEQAQQREEQPEHRLNLVETPGARVANVKHAEALHVRNR